MQLGRLPLCQLSYSRAFRAYQILLPGPLRCVSPPRCRQIGEVAHEAGSALRFVGTPASGTHEPHGAVRLTLTRRRHSGETAREAALA
jgi:hypothetical protein